MKKILNNSKKGFTLIELLAVIVILAVLALVASTNVFNILDNARRGSFRTEFLSMLEAAQTTASIDLMNGEFDHESNTEKYYKLSDKSTINSLGNNFDNKNNYVGCVKVVYNSSGDFTITGRLKGSYFEIVNKDANIKNSDGDIMKTGKTKADFEACNDGKNYCTKINNNYYDASGSVVTEEKYKESCAS